MRAVAKRLLGLGLGLGLLLAGYFQGYLHGTISGLQGALLKDFDDGILRGPGSRVVFLGSTAKHTGFLNITVSEKPFGMHVRRGSTIVEEVFLGFPAQRLGVRKGCEVRELAGEPVTPGSWLEHFQGASVPFALSLFCPPAAAGGEGPLTADKRNFRVMVVTKPFGMNIQAFNSIPRVVDVLPGYPAEKAGVKMGFVLKAVNDAAVNSSNWYSVWQQAPVPCTLTFDTDVPIHKNNPYFKKKERVVQVGRAAQTLPTLQGPGELVDVSVESLPFGMHVSASPGQRPFVHGIVAGMAAAKAGVRKGDVMVEVAGRKVDSSTWFAAFEQAVPPFGLKLWRTHGDGATPAGEAALMLDVKVAVRPFGMHVRQGSAVVGEVFAGLPAQKLGIRPGCEILAIAGANVSAGTWLEAFQQAKTPFALRLSCPPAEAAAAQLEVPAAAVLSSGDNRSLTVVVTRRPFGMNVEASIVPRVVEVLPGYPAESAGVRRGYVLKAVDGTVVNSSNWFDVFQRAPTPCKLTFDTSAPLPAESAAPDSGSQMGASPKSEGASTSGFVELRVRVTKVPFGMQVRGKSGGGAVVAHVVPSLPAEQLGIRPGDEVIEVAGLPVTSSSWFSAFSQAVPPFGLRLRRHGVPDTNATASGTTAGPSVPKAE